MGVQGKNQEIPSAISSFPGWLKKTRQKNDSLLCIGLDPDPEKFPSSLKQEKEAIFRFNAAIIDATHDLVSCYKPQIAYYAAIGAEDELIKTIEYCHQYGIPVILDAKRGDIGSTAEKYAEEIFVRYKADAVTLNPYLGQDSMQPFLDWKDKGVIILCRTSNTGSAEIQNLVLEDGKKLYEAIAEKAVSDWNGNKNIYLVVGATQPEEMKTIRGIVGDLGFLVPGIGAQGGDIKDVMEAGKGGDLIISSSRAILYASIGLDFAQAARQSAEDTRQAINRFRQD